MQGVFLTRLDRDVIVRLMQRLAGSGRSQANDDDFLAVQDPTWVDLARSRERDECRDKLKLLNILPQ